MPASSPQVFSGVVCRPCFSLHKKKYMLNHGATIAYSVYSCRGLTNTPARTPCSISCRTSTAGTQPRRLPGYAHHRGAPTAIASPPPGHAVNGQTPSSGRCTAPPSVHKRAPIPCLGKRGSKHTSPSVLRNSWRNQEITRQGGKDVSLT